MLHHSSFTPFIMPAEEPKKTEKYHWVQGASYETKSIESVLVQRTALGKIMLYLCNARTAFEGTNEFELQDDGQLGKELSNTATLETVFEVQEGILLDLDEARNLRDSLNNFLRDDA